eukprot:Gb_10328 [translate_table: standard]
MGIIERIECDPNPLRLLYYDGSKGCYYAARRTCCNIKSSLCEILKTTMTTINGLFSFSSLPRRVDEMKDIFLPALSSLGTRREATTSPSFGSSLGLPRIAVAGVKPTSFTP